MRLFQKGTKGYYRPNRDMWGELEILYPSKYGYVCHTKERRTVEIYFCDFVCDTL